MNAKDKLANRLLSENGLTPGSMSIQQQRELAAMIARQTKQVRRAKWVMVSSWVINAVWMVIGAVAETAAPKSLFTASAPVVQIGLLWIAVILSLSFYVRHRGLGIRAIQFRLGRIEAELKRLGSDPDKTERH